MKKLLSIIFFLQPSHPLLRIHNLRNARVSVLPEVEEFLIVLYGFALPAFLLVLPIIPHSGKFIRRRRSWKRGSERRESHKGFTLSQIMLILRAA
jgi:hypothetical protein